MTEPTATDRAAARAICEQHEREEWQFTEERIAVAFAAVRAEAADLADRHWIRRVAALEAELQKREENLEHYLSTGTIGRCHAHLEQCECECADDWKDVLVYLAKVDTERATLGQRVVELQARLSTLGG
jgi:hypothetical protein